MLETKPLLVSTYEQETAVAPNRLVTAGSAANEVIEATGTSAFILGISDDAASDVAGDEVGVIMSGVAMLVILSATSRDAAITGSTGGGGLATTTQNNYCVGYLLKATTVSNELAPILVNPFLYPTVT